MAGEDVDKLVAKSLRSRTFKKDDTVLKNIRGKATEVKVIMGTKQKGKLSHNQILNIKNQLDLSTRKVRFLFQGSMCSVSIQPRLENVLTSSAHELDDFFIVEKTRFKKSSSSVTSYSDNYLVYCRSISGFIDYVKGRRNIQDERLLVGIDGGQGSLKFILTIEDNQEASDESKYKDSGVKRCFILAVVENVQENFENVEHIWLKLELGKINAMITGDLKIINVIAGVMSNSSTFPCAFCTVQKKDMGEKFGAMRTIGNIKEKNAAWIAAGSNKVDAKKYYNCAHEPLLRGANETLILDVCPPPSLHLLLGMINLIYDKISAYNPDVAQSWTTASSATRHAQFGFTGRHCRSLLAKRSMLNTGDPIMTSYADVLVSLQNVIDCCFGVDLQGDCGTSISGFRNAWKVAQLPCTPKFHIIHQHVAEFCNKMQKGLGSFSEQTTEAVHKDFSKIWANYKVPITNASYQDKLLSCVVAYNSLHI